MIKTDHQYFIPQIRDDDDVSGPTAADHPGEITNAKRPIIPLAIDYCGASRRSWHDHRRGQLLYAVRGVMQVATKGTSWTVAPEQAVWVPPHTMHRVEHKASVAMRTLYIDKSIVFDLSSTCCVVDVSPLLKELILRVMPVQYDYPVESSEWRLMMVILDELRSLKHEPMHLSEPHDARLKKITSYLLQYPDDNRSLSKWSVICGASERTLARQFVKQTGLTFAQWRERLRLITGIHSLVEGKSLTAVSFDLGYQSPSAFIAMFKRNLGQSPGQFLKQRSIL